MQQETFFAMFQYVVDNLLIQFCTEGNGRQGLSFTASEDSRAMRSGQVVDFTPDRTDLVSLTSVKAFTFVQNAAAHSLFFYIVVVAVDQCCFFCQLFFAELCFELFANSIESVHAFMFIFVAGSGDGISLCVASFVNGFTQFFIVYFVAIFAFYGRTNSLCQFFLSGAEDKTFSVSATDFRSETGDTVPVSLYYQYYFEMDYEGERQDVPDAIPPVKEGAVFTVRAEESAGFVLQAKTSPDTPSGDYTAELTVLNEAGQEVKTATVFLHVWDFTLSEDTVCRTAMWVDKNRLGGHDYQTLYDYLLENRVNAYDLPYALSDPAVDEYLDNPRVNSFNILGFKFNRESGKSEGQIRDAMTYAYEKLSPVAAWKEKGYFYLVDEPNVNESHKLN